jgi:hypothetical protein
MFTPAYICDRLNLGVPWRQHIQTIMRLVEKDSSGKVDTIVSDLILQRSGPASMEVITTLVAGIQMGIEIAEERALSNNLKFFETRKDV